MGEEETPQNVSSKYIDLTGRNLKRPVDRRNTEWQ